ncbi:hydroxymethylglutaryl-CoA reductase, degradative [Streptococcus sp. S784/96/1]|uniref:hydroxymethylglutaryl-CoA reductase, degradative n=1 Tax=Streptococcus sp. S784/96/1 TaxID=2653499 RepID=UPI001EE41AFB|nr:hydroxymethylglutaryl-CoA reductase, degradative [Streptococcus sp. S784/96/1]
MKINWTGFSKKTPLERQKLISSLLTEEKQTLLRDNKQLALKTADQMAEHVLGTFSLPFSIAPDFLIDNKIYHVPMVTEEPSVVAAASFAAKLIKRSGGFTTTIHNRLMIGQVALYNLKDKKIAEQIISSHKEQLLSHANEAHPSILKRGGGARNIWTEEKEEFLIVYLSVDTQEAMGANMLNTMLEAIAPILEEITAGKSLMAILSNYATESLVTAECSVDLRFLSRNIEEAQQLAQKMELATHLAQVDTYRAATHNKGIFNGIDAVVLATGNDWRAIEAAGHSYATQGGLYRGLSNWFYDRKKQQVHGKLTLPMPIATKGGSIGLNPTVQLAHELLNSPSAKELASVIVSVGLAQNFAALKALIGTGIQEGHMKLQAKSLLLLVGATEKEATILLPRLLKEKYRNQETAQELLIDLRNQK